MSRWPEEIQELSRMSARAKPERDQQNDGASQQGNDDTKLPYRRTFRERQLSTDTTLHICKDETLIAQNNPPAKSRSGTPVLAVLYSKLPHTGAFAVIVFKQGAACLPTLTPTALITLPLRSTTRLINPPYPCGIQELNSLRFTLTQAIGTCAGSACNRLIMSALIFLPAANSRAPYTHDVFNYLFLLYIFISPLLTHRFPAQVGTKSHGTKNAFSTTLTVAFRIHTANPNGGHVYIMTIEYQTGLRHRS